MPEGDTVYLTARRLHEALAGRPVLAGDFRVPHLATADVTGRSVVDVVPRGKHLLIRFDDGRTLHTHLWMDGSWQVYPAEALRRLGEQPKREIGPALLDQRNLAGIGNLYKCEVLFLRGVWPWTPVGEVSHLEALVSLAQRLLHANKDRWQQVTTGVAAAGREHWVFERSGRPCRRCGKAISSAEQGDRPNRRLSYWCPSCQPRWHRQPAGTGGSP